METWSAGDTPALRSILITAVRSELEIDYARWLDSLPSRSVDDVLRAFREDIAPACLDRYQRMCGGPTNVLEIPLKGVHVPLRLLLGSGGAAGDRQS